MVVVVGEVMVMITYIFLFDIFLFDEKWIRKHFLLHFCTKSEVHIRRRDLELNKALAIYWILDYRKGKTIITQNRK